MGRFNFLVIDDETYTIKEALNKGLLIFGDWFEYEGDVYLFDCVGWEYTDGNPSNTKIFYEGYKLDRDGVERADIRKNYKILTYKGYADKGYTDYIEAFERNEFEDRPISYRFDEDDKIRLVWIRQGMV